MKLALLRENLLQMGGAIRHMVESEPVFSFAVAERAYKTAAQQLHDKTGLGWEFCDSLTPYAHMWAEGGFQTVEVGHRLAASLMATSTANEYVKENVRVPWMAFSFTIPAGILDEYDWFILSLDNGYIAVQDPSSPGALAFKGSASSLHELCDTDDRQKFVDGVSHFAGWQVDVDQITRRQLLVSRLFVGICLEIGNYRAAESSSQPSPNRHNKVRKTNVFKLCRAVKVDVRSAILNFAAGRSTRPTIQTLVRGHWKMQPHGAKLADRKFIHVEPYWRGPEEAPVAVRSHILGAE